MAGGGRTGQVGLREKWLYFSYAYLDTFLEAGLHLTKIVDVDHPAIAARQAQGDELLWASSFRASWCWRSRSRSVRLSRSGRRAHRPERWPLSLSRTSVQRGRGQASGSPSVTHSVIEAGATITSNASISGRQPNTMVS